MQFPFAPLQFLVLLIILFILFVVIQVGALTIAFDKLGLSEGSAITLLLTALVGSAINLPLFKIKATQANPQEIPPWLRGLLRIPQREFKGFTQIYVNVGGCLLPLTVSFYLLRTSGLDIPTVLFAILVMTAVSYGFSRPLHGVGIGMPMFIAPIAAALLGMFLAPEASAPLAYISGTLGVLIGADLLRLKDIRNMGSPVASIGGAGTFDGIFITGIVAALLA